MNDIRFPEYEALSDREKVALEAVLKTFKELYETRHESSAYVDFVDFLRMAVDEAKAYNDSIEETNKLC